MQALGQGPATQEKPAAYVNGEAISMTEIQAMLEARPSPVPLTAAQQREFRQSALDMLIDDVLMRQFLRKNALPPQPAEIQKEIDELNEVLKKKTMTLDQFLRESKQTEAQFRQDVAARVLVETLSDWTLSRNRDASAITKPTRCCSTRYLSPPAIFS